MNERKSTMTALLLAFSLALGVGSAFAQGGGTVPPGTIYFTWSGLTWTMDGSGGNKTALPAGVSGEPSRLLHGGQRWFLQFTAVAGTYPDGGQRHELFAIRGDGLLSVQLTDQADLEPFGNPGANPDSRFPAGRWTFSDSKVSWIAARW